jgi:hypothetical protein
VVSIDNRGMNSKAVIAITIETKHLSKSPQGSEKFDMRA